MSEIGRNPLVESAVLGQVELNPDRHLRVELTVEGTEIDAVLPPHRDIEDPDYVVGIENSTDADGERSRRYLKIPSRLRGASHTVIEYYETHENLQKGVKVVSVVAGAVAVGSLAVWRFKNRRR